MVQTPRSSATPSPNPQAPGPHPVVLLAVLAAVIAGGCQYDAGSTPGAFAQDPWTLSGPDLRIGSLDDPDYVFGPIGSLRVGPDGLLYTLHWGEAMIRRWTMEGVPAGSLGRRGEGPGEFEEATRMGFFGDSLWVWDSEHYRVSYFDTGGEFIGSVMPRFDFGGMAESPPRPEIPLRDGTFLGISPAWSDGIARGTVTGSPHVRMDADGGTVARIWTMPWEPRDIFALLRDGGGSYGSQPFGDSHSVSFGESSLVTVNRRAWTGSGEAALTVSRIGFDGDTIFTVRVPYEPLPLSAERFEAALAERVERRSSMSAAFQASEGRIREALYRPSHLPAVRGTMQARDGTFWLRRWDPVETGTGEHGEQVYEWWVLDAEGAPLARARTPIGLSIRLIDGDTVWGVETDELGVEYIVRYRLTMDG